jgi:hypothetical protein
VGVWKGAQKVRLDSEEFPFHAEESAQPPGAENCVEGRVNLLWFPCGPFFWDLAVWGNSNMNLDSWINLGISYTNDTGLDGSTFFTGSKVCQVKEIEVFDIALPPTLAPSTCWQGSFVK